MSYARVRFFTALIAIGTGALLGVGALSFGPATERWLGLGVGASALTSALVAFASRGQGMPARSLYALLVPVCAWTIVASRTLELSEHAGSPAVVKWLGLASGAAIALTGAILLLVHELGVESDLRWASGRLSEMVPAEPAEATRNGHARNGHPQENERVERWADEVSRTAG